MLVRLCKHESRFYRVMPPVQDVVAGDGTTSVVVICGALLKKCMELLEKGVHPTVISDSFAKAAAKACEVRHRPTAFCIQQCLARVAAGTSWYPY